MSLHLNQASRYQHGQNDVCFGFLLKGMQLKTKLVLFSAYLKHQIFRLNFNVLQKVSNRHYVNYRINIHTHTATYRNTYILTCIYTKCI